ncbi:MAG: DedA family protein [Aurantimonas coralicida]|uniref:DedA family protein n=1 Tax=Aurantimonas TaxID=182269 RepID=UPI0004033773|nr:MULTISPECIES: DedA family protein [Aurantimonas]MAY27956.1 DedA family protein [Aurantimonas sp.]MCW7542246.1 DedA family protein [Aurantimonas litoralis]MBC6716055.1 DedA family protein [Aurantimonas sp. DM33-3]MCC4297665.1 DedA family protein [Aurantimonas coralicida]MDE0922800.1 DedA family protein [Aurantimonas coralicida]|tara:strand:- start:142 stop:774 length:633 start_codon:yes stop_codon:yes gene_type:complete
MDAFVRSMMETLGPFGIALLMFLENVFPPIPSELIMPLAGYQSASGQMSLVTVILAGTVGSLLGVIPWYYAGRFVGERRLKRFTERHGRWLTMAPEDVDAADRWFRKYGIAAVLFGRLVPAVRTLISVPAGIAKMSFLTFLVFSAIGSAAWTTLLAYAGYALGQNYEAVESYVGPVSNAVLIAIVGFYIYRVATFDRSHTRAETTDDSPR